MKQSRSVVAGQRSENSRAIHRSGVSGIYIELDRSPKVMNISDDFEDIGTGRGPRTDYSTYFCISGVGELAMRGHRIFL